MTLALSEMGRSQASSAVPYCRLRICQGRDRDRYLTSRSQLLPPLDSPRRLDSSFAAPVWRPHRQASFPAITRLASADTDARDQVAGVLQVSTTAYHNSPSARQHRIYGTTLPRVTLPQRQGFRIERPPILRSPHRTFKSTRYCTYQLSRQNSSGIGVDQGYRHPGRG